MEKTDKKESQKTKKPFYKKPLGCLFILVGGFFLFVVLATLIGVWVAGRMVPTIAADILKDKAGAGFTVQENNINFFAGRFDLKDVALTNPSRFHEKSFVTLNQVKAEIDLGSLATDTIVIPELTLDIKEFTFVGKGSSPTTYGTDNNISDFAKAFSGEDGDTQKKPDEPKDTAPKSDGEQKHFHIKKLKISLDRLRAVINDGAETPGTLADTKDVFSLEITDVTDENISEKVYKPIEALLNTKGLGIVVSAVANAFMAEASATLQAAKDKASEALNAAGEAASGAVNKASEAAKSATDAASKFLDGLKPAEPKK